MQLKLGRVVLLNNSYSISGSYRLPCLLFKDVKNLCKRQVDMVNVILIVVGRISKLGGSYNPFCGYKLGRDRVGKR